jgi:hypothetical protein
MELQQPSNMELAEGSDMIHNLAGGSSLLSADLDNIDKLGELSSFSG